MDKALNGPSGFRSGETYDFESLTLIEAANSKEFKPSSQAGGFQLMNVPAPHGLFRGPNTSALEKKIKTKMAVTNDKKFADVCGQCGSASGEAGVALLICGKCKKREYCGPECQKKHWKTHKLICVKPKAERP